MATKKKHKKEGRLSNVFKEGAALRMLKVLLKENPWLTPAQARRVFSKGYRLLWGKQRDEFYKTALGNLTVIELKAAANVQLTKGMAVAIDAKGRVTPVKK